MVVMGAVKSLHKVSGEVLTPYFMKIPLYCLPLLFQILSTPLPPYFPVTYNPHPNCSFCCPVSLAEWMIMPHLMCYFTKWIYTCRALVSSYQKNLDVCFMQQGVKITGVWHIMWFLLVLWFDIKHTHTQKHTNTPSTLRGQ